jgi:hypothetical protein
VLVRKLRIVLDQPTGGDQVLRDQISEAPRQRAQLSFDRTVELGAGDTCGDRRIVTARAGLVLVTAGSADPDLP